MGFAKSRPSSGKFRVELDSLVQFQDALLYLGILASQCIDTLLVGFPRLLWGHPSRCAYHVSSHSAQTAQRNHSHVVGTRIERTSHADALRAEARRIEVQLATQSRGRCLTPPVRADEAPASARYSPCQHRRPRRVEAETEVAPHVGVSQRHQAATAVTFDEYSLRRNVFTRHRDTPLHGHFPERIRTNSFLHRAATQGSIPPSSGAARSSPTSHLTAQRRSATSAENRAPPTPI